MTPILFQLLVLAFTALPQSEESVLVPYDLRAVLPRWDSDAQWSQALLVPPAVDPRFGLETVEGSLEYAELTSFEVMDLLSQILGDELRREGREIVVEGTTLEVLAPPAMQEQVRSILEGLEMSLAGTVPVRVDVVTLGEGSTEPAPATVLGEEEAAKLLAALVGRGLQHRSYVLELSAGRTTRLDASRKIPFLFDYDVEIAHAMCVFDPVIAEAMDGTRLVLRGSAVQGGLALSVVFQQSDLIGKIAAKQLELRGLVNDPEKGKTEPLEGPKEIQSPEVLVRGLAFDTLLPDGKALALYLEASLGAAATREVLLIRRLGGSMSSYVSRPIPRTNRTLIALNAELFRRPRLSSRALGWNDDRDRAVPMVGADFDGEVSSFLIEWVKARFSVWRRFGPWILIVTEPAWDRDAAGQLDRLVKSLRPETELLSLAVDLRIPGRQPVTPVRFRLPVLAGSSVGLVLGRGTTAVTDYDVEVAQGAAVADPVVSSVFEGLALSILSDAAMLEASGMAQVLDSAITSLDSGYDLYGSIERPEPRVLRFDERLRLPEGTVPRVRIGGTSDRPEQPGMTVEISIGSIQR